MELKQEAMYYVWFGSTLETVILKALSLDGKIAWVQEVDANGRRQHYKWLLVDQFSWIEVGNAETKDVVVEAVINKYKERSAVGIEKYGTTLADNPSGLKEWLNHLQEELMDAVLYIQRAKGEM